MRPDAWPLRNQHQSDVAVLAQMAPLPAGRVWPPELEPGASRKQTVVGPAVVSGPGVTPSRVALGVQLRPCQGRGLWRLEAGPG